MKLNCPVSCKHGSGSGQVLVNRLVLFVNGERCGTDLQIPHGLHEGFDFASFGGSGSFQILLDAKAGIKRGDDFR
jgi:hypothetical protein